MSHHNYCVKLDKSQISGEMSTLNILKYFLKEDRALDDEIRKEFPLSNYGDKDDTLLIKGVKELIASFNIVDQEKLDIPEKLLNIEYIGLSNDNQIILMFKKDNIKAEGIYDFSYSFLDDIFQMGKFSRFCMEKGYRDLLRKNIESLIGNLGDIEKQYRLLKVNDSYKLRGITSLRYRNYDNHLALYLALLSIHSYSKENQKAFSLESAYMTDSEIKIFLEQIDPIKIEGFGDLYLGLYIANNEIGDKAFSLQLRYSIVDSKGIRFSGMKGLEDAIFNLNHSTGINNFKEKMKNIFTLKERQDLLIDHINGIKNAEKLSENVIYLLFKKLANSTQKLSKKTRFNAKELKNGKVIDNTMNIIEIFNEVEKITGDLDEKIYLERIYDEVITELYSS